MDGIDDRDHPDILRDVAAFILERAPLIERVERLTTLRERDPARWAREGVEALAERLRADEQPPVALALLQADPVAEGDSGLPGARILEQDLCEPAAWFAGRVAAQAMGLPEPSILVAVPDARPAGVSLDAYSIFNLPPDTAVRHAQWYAELRASHAAFAVAGVIDLSGDAPPAVGGPLGPAEAGPLGRFLRRHPDRQRHPLDAGAGWRTVERWSG
ncbi:MAG: hypothetical protein R6T85_11255 [Egibacteraceae bacterium]